MQNINPTRADYLRLVSLLEYANSIREMGIELTNKQIIQKNAFATLSKVEKQYICFP